MSLYKVIIGLIQSDDRKSNKTHHTSPTKSSGLMTVMKFEYENLLGSIGIAHFGSVQFRLQKKIGLDNLNCGIKKKLTLINYSK